MDKLHKKGVSDQGNTIKDKKLSRPFVVICSKISHKATPHHYISKFLQKLHYKCPETLQSTKDSSKISTFGRAILIEI